jgi:hypothetical protein
VAETSAVACEERRLKRKDSLLNGTGAVADVEAWRVVRIRSMDA